MKKLYTLLLITISSLSFGQGPFTATYDFASVTTTSGATDPTPVPVVSGMTFGSFSAVNTTTPPTNSNAASRFSFVNQPLGATNNNDSYASLTGSLDANIYFQVTVTPVAGTTYNLTGITFRQQRSGTGVRTYSVRSSADGYAANLPASINPANTELSVEAGNTFFRVLDATTSGQNGSTITLSGPSFTGITTPVTFRFYGWNAEAAGGTFSIDDVVISGNVTTLSSNSFDGIKGLSMYPNPLKGNTLYLTSTANAEMSVQIYDVLGKEVVNSKVMNNTVNVSGLTSGVYIVKVTEEGKTATRKLVIQ